jgi:hypothetical protein
MAQCANCGTRDDSVDWVRPMRANLCLTCFADDSVSAETIAADTHSKNGDGPETEGRILEDARVDLIKLIRDGIPERQYVPGCDGWLIAGKRYLVYSPAGVGKSIGTLVVAVEIVRHGGTVAIIDTENGADEYARRLELIVGDDADVADACSERLRYYEYPPLSLDWSERDWIAALADCDVIVFDSSRHVLSAFGLAEDANDDYARFMGRMVMPLSKAGQTTVILDNTGHDGDHPRGASAKRDLNEILFQLSLPDGDLELDTERRLVWRRTRGRFASSVPRVMEQRIGGGTYEAPQPVDGDGERDRYGDQSFRPTVLMERISQYVEFDDGCSQNKILEHVDGKNTGLISALGTLVDEGYIRREPGPRNAMLHHSITPYRGADDDCFPTVSPTVSRPSAVDTTRPFPPTVSPLRGNGGETVEDAPVPELFPGEGTLLDDEGER